MDSKILPKEATGCVHHIVINRASRPSRPWDVLRTDYFHLMEAFMATLSECAGPISRGMLR